ncbi:PhoH family protein [Spirilliplanes yamanashiensis]|uniref:Phosphate starvation protein PhoH n=1 Tax=Spirilliplanes yamanashiensis TaxID=42233 RepID=A0A8J4DGJ0_9ACTN|nr:PhoH-like ATPase [Spirilliplanes yamanashiensis]GIJ00899.1 phosphate starvation protein PhoH [Spirilliplanes yamanashiensis]
MTTRRTDAATGSRTARRAPRSVLADAEPVSTSRVFVLDTSVLLSDPAAFRRFSDHEIVLPLVVISELEGKRHHPELGWFARQALRMLDDLRIKHGRLDEPVPANDEGGTLRVELNHADDSVLPLGFRNESNDARILSVALGLAVEGREVTLVSKDMPLRVKAASVGLTADEYRFGQAMDPTWTGMADLELSEEQVGQLYAGETIDVGDAAGYPTHTGLVVHSPRGSGLARVLPDKTIRLVRGDRDAFGLRGRSAEQRVALDLLMDDSIGIVSLGGRAGTGKSALALCAGLEQTMERGKHKKVVVFRPLYAVGGQELGYLPGSESEKMSPWAQAVFDTLGAVVHDNVMDEILGRGMLEVLPLTHIRGRSLHDAFVIVDEAQSLERGVLLTVLSRIGQGSRVVLTHDVAQRDNLRVGRHDGVTAVIEALKGHELFAHVTLTRSERSPIAEVVTDLLEDIPL